MIYPTLWRNQPQEVRNKLAEVFKLEKDEAIHVVDGKIASDGFSPHQLVKITIPLMQEFSGRPEIVSEEELFTLCAIKAGAPAPEPTPEPVEKEAEYVVADPTIREVMAIGGSPSKDIDIIYPANEIIVQPTGTKVEEEVIPALEELSPEEKEKEEKRKAREEAQAEKARLKEEQRIATYKKRKEQGLKLAELSRARWAKIKADKLAAQK